jgi:hypothetical protein
MLIRADKSAVRAINRHLRRAEYVVNLRHCRCIQATKCVFFIVSRTVERGQSGFVGSVPIWNPGGTLISHIDAGIFEAGISLRVSYIGLAISELDDP